MKKKVFSLMMMLLLAFIGVAKAEVVTIGEGTSTYYYYPVNMYFNYSLTEQLYTPDEIGTAGTINAISFYYDYSSAFTMNNVTLYMKNVTRDAFASNTDMEPLTLADIVWTGTFSATGAGWVTITLDTPFAYDGVSNLLVAGFDGTSGYPGSAYKFRTTPCEGYKGIHWYSDSYCPDPYNTAGGFSGSKSYTQYRSNIQLDITAGGGGGQTVEVTIGDPTSTSTNSYLPTYSLYNYSFTQQIYTADEIGVGGTINTLTMWLKNSSSYARNLNIYMKEVSESTFASGSAWVSMTAGDLVATTTLANGISSPVETTINLSAPFAYTGNGNLVICVQDVTGSWSSGAAGVIMSANGSQAIYAYRDSSLYDPTAPGVSGYTLTSKNVVRLSITTAGGGQMGDPIVALQDGEVVETVVVGTRPNGCWMEPFRFALRNDGPATNVSLIDFTPQEYFTVVEPEMPFHMAHNEEVEVALATGTSTNTAWQMVAIYGEGRTARIWDIVAEPYDPAIPDVWELACEEATTFPFVEVPATAHNTVLHNDYTLPFPEIPEGNDAVYKLVFDEDQMINAEVTYGENGKVALYTEDFYGEGGPMATNNYTGIGLGGGAAAAPFEAQIGEGTSTSGYFPFYCFYNYSCSQQLFLAAELEEAGVTSANMTSLSWYCTATNGNLQSNITIWMANVEATALSTPTMLTSGMDKVYTGNMTPVVGWNEFVFNEGTFSWDGHSNILISVQRNNGAWASGVNWQVGAQSFTAGAYYYTDSQGTGYGPLDMTTTGYSGYTSTNRANIIMKADGSRNRDQIVNDFESGLNGWTVIDANNDGYTWCLTSAIPSTWSYYSSLTLDWYHGGSDAICSGSYINGVGALYPDEYLVSPQVTLGEGSELSFWVAATDATYAADHFGVFISDNGTSNWTSVQEWTLTAKGGGKAGNPLASRDGEGLRLGNWYNYTVNLSAYTGQKYIAFRHFNCTDEYIMCLDDITLTTGSNPTPPGPNPPTPPTPGGATYNIAAGPVIENLPVTPGTYYLVASSTTDNFEVTINAEDMPCPQVEGFAFNPVPADDEDGVEPASVTLRWSIPDFATGWRLIFGTTYYPDPNHPQTIMYPEDGSFATGLANSYTVRNLWNNTNYFWRVEFNNDGCPGGVSSPIWGFTTHLNVPQNLTAVDQTVFNDETIVLNWTAVVDRTYRMYNVYRDGQLIGHTNVNQIGNTTYTDGPLAYNMSGYTYYVTAVYDEGESAHSNTVNVKVSGYGDVNGHVYEQDGTTGIAGATVTMVGNDEFNVSHTYNFTTNNQGYYSGHIYAGSYNGQAAKDGYQTITEPVQGNPIAIDYNQTTSPIDYMLDENFDPVCTVIAEYYPDSLDPHSPYVKVYWGCGLPGEEIIEPFETGDFSLFDWQVDPTYPWTITTYQPYEGTYCMKSGGAGVPSVISNMTVTVNIPADGEMSFFGKISCESNWDYGYFYIDGVQKGSYTGQGSWGEKKFDITAGDHTFQWRYTKDSSVNSYDDCFYVDYITFYKRPEPAQPGWHTYCESEFNNAVGSSLTNTPSWAYEYPASFLHNTYAGWNITKVSLFSDNMYSAVGGNYTCRIYVGGSQPAAGTMVSQLTVDVPSNQNAWVDWDLTDPVHVTGNDPIWVVWTANTTVSSWPAGCCGDLNDLGTWWDGGNGWEHLTYGTWTMRHWFTNRSGRSVAVEAADIAPVAVAQSNVNSKLRSYVKGEESNEAICANPNAVKGAALENGGNRSLNHYRVYRTNCYNDGPYTEENTVLLATVWVPDTVYIDVEWADLAPGVYKWGVGAVYEGNRGEMIEAPVNWAAPVTITRDATADNTTNPVAGEDNGNRAPWDLMHTFNCTSGYQYGVASDGNYIYTSSWSASSTSQFYKYDLQGNFVEEFNVSGSGQIRDLTYDGQYFYGVANSTTVYCLDLANHALINTFTSGYGAAQRCISYDPQRDGFWVVGNWSGNLKLIDRTGAVQITGATPTSASGVAYYKDENNVEHVYCFDNSSNLIYDYDIASNTIVGTAFDFNATPGCTGTSGGCHVGEYNGKIAFFGDSQQSPNLIGIYELKDAGTPGPGPGPSGNNPIQLPRESEIVWSNCLDKDMYLENGDVTVNVLLNSADSPEGVTVSFTNYNEAEQELYPIDDVVLDETGFYAFESFRRGDYKVNVTFEGYEPIEDSVSIWEATDLRYVMTEIIYGVSDLYVSSTGWAMWGAQGIPSGPTPGPGGNGSTFNVDFEGGLPSGWNVIDGNNDGYTWCLTSAIPSTWTYYASLTLDWYHGGSNAICSGSYINGVGALNPDEYLVSPQVTLAAGSQLSFWVAATDVNYPADHFGVFVSDNGTSNWTSVQEWTLTAKKNGLAGGPASRDGEGLRLGTWYHYTVDLSAYAGQKYVAFRHFNCYDQYIMCLDDIELTSGSKDGDRHLEGFKVMCTSLDGEPIFNANTPATQPFCQLATDELVPGDHYICKVAAMYSTGMSGWLECEWQYIPCENYAGTVNGVTLEGNTVMWDYPGGGPTPPPGNGDTFSINFDDSQMPAGWTIIDGGSPAGYGWQIGSTKLGGTGNGHNGSADLILSQSYDNNYGVVYPDNWFISPAVTLASGSQFSLWACGQDANYAAEHFGVFVSTTGTNPSDFTLVQEWTLTAKDGGNVMGIGRDGQMRAQGNWYQKTVDLGAYAGAGRYIAVRHFNCSDMFYLDVDDLELTNGAKGNRAEWTFQNGFVTDPGAMANGADASWIKGSQSTWGPNVNNGGGYMLADSFTLDAATTIDEITVYAYQTGSSTNSTFTGMYAQIYNGAPNAGGSAVWGDMNSNIMTATAFTNCYRGSDGETNATTRPIMSVTAGGLSVELEAGTYYLVYSLTGSGSSGPWGAPHCEPVIGNTGNGYQYTSSGWTTLTDSGAGTPYGCAMTLHGNTGGTGPTPPPSGDIIGAMIFVDGEWEAFVEAPTNTYEYEGDGEIICVRIIYNGTNNLPEGNIYYSMSCPECIENNIIPFCEPGEPIHCEDLYETDQIKVWWGDEPIPGMSEWIYYDDGTYATNVGTGDASATVYWASMFPAASIAPYAGTNLTKVAVYENSYNTNPITVTVYLGGTTAPGTAYSTQTFTPTGNEFQEVTLNTPVAIDGTQNLWIVMAEQGAHPATACVDTGEPNNRWISLDGASWQDLASAGLPGYGWMIRGFVTNEGKSGMVENIAIEPAPAMPVSGNMTLGHTEVVSKPADLSFMNRAELVKYNVYRSTDNNEYTMIGEVAAVAGQTYYEYIDTPAEVGTYYYQVRAEYDNDCESDPAPAFDDPTVNYVTGHMTGIDENGANVALYPNPTKGNVTIEANGMSRITVVSVLGQVVFDTELDADTYTLNMAQFNAGMYMVRVYTEGGVTVKRVTVMQ